MNYSHLLYIREVLYKIRDIAIYSRIDYYIDIAEEIIDRYDEIGDLFEEDVKEAYIVCHNLVSEDRDFYKELEEVNTLDLLLKYIESFYGEAIDKFNEHCSRIKLTPYSIYVIMEDDDDFINEIYDDLNEMIFEEFEVFVIFDILELIYDYLTKEKNKDEQS